MSKSTGNGKHPGGRPRKIASPEEFEAMAESYFEECDKDKKPYTVTGLALAVGLCGRHELADYEVRNEYAPAIKRAKARCEEWLLKNSFNMVNPAAAIFLLKNFGYSDRQELVLDHTVHHDIELSALSDNDLELVLRVLEKVKLAEGNQAPIALLPGANTALTSDNS